jgi:hypothetical protein
MAQMTCPFCGAVAEVPTIDIGVGDEQCGPAECPKCGAAQDNDRVWREASYWEADTNNNGDDI